MKPLDDLDLGPQKGQEYDCIHFMQRDPADIEALRKWRKRRICQVSSLAMPTK